MRDSTQQPPKKQFCSIEELRIRTGRSPASVFRDIKSGRIPHVRLGHSVLIPMSYFDNLEEVAYEVVNNANE